MEEKEFHRNQDEQTPGWLKTIQLNSWEAELLISALVLYALFQVPEFLEKTSLQTFDRDSRMHGLFGLLEKAIQLLSCGYILHILVRGIWVASVGLSYVYPKGIDSESLKFKGNFKKELTKTVKQLYLRKISKDLGIKDSFEALGTLDPKVKNALVNAFQGMKV